MTRIQARDLRGKIRVPLWEVVPLDAPWTLFLDITNHCNFKCVFCPTGNPDMIQGRGRGNMSLELIGEIIQDLFYMPRLKMLNLYKDGEPLMHPQFTGIVRRFKAANIAEKIWTKTNGELLGRFEALPFCGLDMLGISVPHVTPEGCERVMGRKLDYDRYVDGIRRVYNGKRTFEMSIKIADVGLTDSEKDKFYNDFEGICEYIAIEGLHGWSASDVKNMQIHDSGTFDGNPFTEKRVCPLPFYMMTINYDGSVSVCNDDWLYAHQLGNVNTETLSEIWNGDKFNAFRKMHLDGRRCENRACGTCQYINALPDNIDDHADEMRERFI